MSWNLAIKLEHEVARIITQQEINGWKFDKELAERHIVYLDNEREVIYNKIRPLLVPEIIHDRAEVKEIYKKTGDYSKRVSDYWGDSVYSVGGPHNLVRFEEPDLGSRQKLMRQLERHGWRAINYTDKGNPKLDEESLEGLSGGVGGDIARWYLYSHRRGQIQGWLDNLRDDGRISAQANTCGTNTGRFTHRLVVNVPKAAPQVVFGKEMRSLFIVEDGYVLVGHDASGLELRMLAHYLNNPEYTEILLSGDLHEYHRELAGLPNRDAAKTFIYAFNYGASDTKLGSIVGGTSKDGAALRERFLARNKGLQRLISEVQARAKRGYLEGLDGRRMPIRSLHSAFNVLLQGAGAVVMKTSMCYLDKWLKREGITLNEVKKVGDFHDEGEAEVINDRRIIDLYKDLAVNSVRQSGRFLNLRCPLDAEAKEGPTWAETH